jgi:phenylalanyl-tRNA synthetase alpha chain
MSLADDLTALRSSARTRLAAAATAEEVDGLRHALLGRSGELTALLKALATAPSEDRPTLGRLANEVRAELEAALEARLAALQGSALEEPLAAGNLHMS